HDDLAVVDRLGNGVNSNRLAIFAGRAGEAGRYFAAAVKRSVQGAVGIVARQGDVQKGAPFVLDLGRPGDQDLTVRLESHATAPVVVGTEIGEPLAARAKGGIETSGRGVASQREVIAGAGAVVVPDRQDLAVRLDR